MILFKTLNFIEIYKSLAVHKKHLIYKNLQPKGYEAKFSSPAFLLDLNFFSIHLLPIYISVQKSEHLCIIYHWAFMFIRIIDSRKGPKGFFLLCEIEGDQSRLLLSDFNFWLICRWFHICFLCVIFMIPYCSTTITKKLELSISVLWC